ncbi:MAG: PAS domain-containing sensor histidine kinase [Burkholderiales bacterium]|nr:MAG: PAS domain-containing sensor histidine kinase [Burkholderiales bacterium]
MPRSGTGAAGPSTPSFEALAPYLPGAILRYRVGTSGQEQLEHISPDGLRLWGLDPAATPPDMGALWTLVEAEDRVPLNESLADCARRRIDWEHQWRITAPSGERRWLHGQGRPTLDADGSTVWHILFVDLIHSRTQRLGRRMSEERFRRLIDAIPDVAVQGYDRDLVCRFWNSASERLYGYSETEALGRNLLDLIIPEAMRQEVILATRHMLETGQAIPSAELRLRHKDGSAVNVHSGHVLLRHEDSDPEFFCIDFDLSERQRAEDARQLLQSQLREAQKMEALGTLAGGIAHDFNNILAAILGNAGLALDECGDGSPASTSLREIQKAARRARSVVQQILTFARRQETRHHVLDLPPLVQEVHSLLRTTAPAGVAIELDIEPGLPGILGDANQFEQVMLNFGTNAVQAVSGRYQARVRIELARGRRPSAADADCWQVLESACPAGREGMLIRVSDNGIGMAAQDMQRIFEPFFTTKGRGEGTGLGLAVVHGILREHHAHLTLRTRPGIGTAFEIWLEAAGSPQPTTVPDDPVLAARQRALRPGRVLYVDDDTLLTDLVSRQLARAGHQVETHSDPLQALRRLSDGGPPFDVLVVDHNMPQMSGLDLADAARRLQPGMPVILTSAVVTDHLQASAAGRGIARVVEKSGSVQQLVDTIDGLTSGP